MKVLLLLSGGLDSVTLLHRLMEDGHQVQAVTFSYGQRHYREIQAALYWSSKMRISHHFIDLPAIFAGSALTGDSPVPHGHYSDESMRSTVVPNRNMVFLSIAAAKAIQLELDAVAYAAHSSDAAVYPDCRPEFVVAMEEALARCHSRPVILLTPFLGMTKGEIANAGRALGIDYSKTWSCYEGGAEPCGKCGPCVARREVGA